MSIDSKDFATGKPINSNHPEEKVRQEFERILVNEYNYPLTNLDIEVPIQIGSKSYSCDIAIYDENKKIVGIIETKKKGRKDGKKQLESYMSATSTCRWGVWTNGEEELCAIKKENGEVYFDAAIRIPHCGVGYPCIEKYDDLIPATNLKRTFKIINNALYANTNLARTEKQGAEMVRLLFCKLMDEYNIRQNKSSPTFQIYQDEHKSTKSNKKKLRQRINKLWEATKGGWVGSSIFGKSERIEIDDYSLRLIVSKLQSYGLLKTEKDIVGDAFEVFSEKQFAGEKGQFFTPRAVVNMVVKMIDPTKDDIIIDPACGSGGFLISALDHITKGILDEGEKKQIAEHCLFGIDKESDLAKICKAHMSILGDGRSNIVQQDSLKPLDDWKDEAKGKITNEGEFKDFDVCITNPPFGSKIKVSRADVLERFELGHKWKRISGIWEQTQETKPTPPQILFLELCLTFLVKPGGKIGIVLPDGLLGNPTDGYIRYFIQKYAEILAVIDCPVETFMPHTGTKTSILILKKDSTSPHPNRSIEDRSKKTFFAIAEHCGHTMRGYDSEKEDFSAITANFTSKNTEGHLGFKAKYKDVLVPRYYDPRIVDEIKRLESDFSEMPTVSELIQDKIISVQNIPSSASGKDYDIHGEIRFIRTSDICGYELYGRTQKNVSIVTYELYKEKQDLRKRDIIFVKDGDTKVGETAILLNEDDLRILVQTHFKKIRALKINPFLLLWMINKDIVKRQIRQRVFSQSTLSTIGDRIKELRLPLPSKEISKCLTSNGG